MFFYIIYLKKRPCCFVLLSVYLTVLQYYTQNLYYEVQYILCAISCCTSYSNSTCTYNQYDILRYSMWNKYILQYSIELVQHLDVPSLQHQLVHISGSTFHSSVQNQYMFFQYISLPAACIFVMLLRNVSTYLVP